MARPASLPKLSADHAFVRFHEMYSSFQSALLEAEVELAATKGVQSGEERGLIALRLLTALAAHPSPIQSLLSCCLEAMRPCMLARAATEAEAALGDASAAAIVGNEGPAPPVANEVTHMAMSAKLGAEIAELNRQARCCSCGTPAP